MNEARIRIQITENGSFQCEAYEINNAGEDGKLLQSSFSSPMNISKNVRDTHKILHDVMMAGYAVMDILVESAYTLSSHLFVAGLCSDVISPGSAIHWIVTVA